jgi:hypothetical protein
MATKRGRVKSQKSRRPKILVKAGKSTKSLKFRSHQKALSSVSALAKQAMERQPKAGATRIDVAANPFRDAAESSVWVEMGPLWLQRNVSGDDDPEI